MHRAVVAIVLVVAAPVAGQQVTTGFGSPIECVRAAGAGEAEAERIEGSAGWTLGGVLLPGIMPLIASTTDPLPPASLYRQQETATLACFEEGYRRQARAKKARGGWIGTGIAVAVAVVIGAVLSGGVDRGPRWAPGPGWTPGP